LGKITAIIGISGKKATGVIRSKEHKMAEGIGEPWGGRNKQNSGEEPVYVQDKRGEEASNYFWGEGEISVGDPCEGGRTSRTNSILYFGTFRWVSFGISKGATGDAL